MIVISGYGSGEVERLCSGDTGYAFLQKPFRPDRLLASVADALAGSVRRSEAAGAA